MRNEIIKRNVLIVGVSLLIFFIASIMITSYTSRKSLENNLINITHVVNNQIDSTTTEDELFEVVDQFTIEQDWLHIIITNSSGFIIKDTSNDSIGTTVTQQLTEKELGLINNEADIDRIYLVENRMNLITKINDDIIIKTSLTYDDNTEYILLSLFYLLLLLIGVILVSLFYSKKISDNIIHTFNGLCSNLKSINEGTYLEIDTSHKYPEVADMLYEINEINNNIYLSMLQIKNEHQKIDFVINNMQQGIMIINKHGEILLLNDYFKYALKIRDDNYQNKKYNEIITNDLVNIKISKAIDNKNNYYFDIEDNEKSMIFSCSINYLRNKWSDLNKDERLYVIVITDVTEERETDKINADFISNASHELKTPITSIRGFAELMLDDKESINEKNQKYLNIIYNESIKMKNTIDELLYLSNLQHQHNNEDKLELVYFKDVVEEIIDEYRSLAAASNIKFELDIDDSSIYEPSKLINHLVKNLIENAIKYNKVDGVVKVKVKTIKHQIIMEIEDSGIGIEEKNFNKIFDRFYRVDSSHNQNTGGTGLGLNIVKQICIALNAKIEVSSRIDIGTVFKVTFNKEER